METVKIEKIFDGDLAINPIDTHKEADRMHCFGDADLFNAARNKCESCADINGCLSIATQEESFYNSVAYHDDVPQCFGFAIEKENNDACYLCNLAFSCLGNYCGEDFDLENFLAIMQKVLTRLAVDLFKKNRRYGSAYLKAEKNPFAPHLTNMDGLYSRLWEKINRLTAQRPDDPDPEDIHRDILGYMVLIETVKELKK